MVRGGRYSWWWWGEKSNGQKDIARTKKADDTHGPFLSHSWLLLFASSLSCSPGRRAHVAQWQSWRGARSARAVRPRGPLPGSLALGRRDAQSRSATTSRARRAEKKDFKIAPWDSVFTSAPPPKVRRRDVVALLAFRLSRFWEPNLFQFDFRLLQQGNTNLLKRSVVLVLCILSLAAGWGEMMTHSFSQRPSKM